jgi:hypothetical protein
MTQNSVHHHHLSFLPGWSEAFRPWKHTSSYMLSPMSPRIWEFWLVWVVEYQQYTSKSETLHDFIEVHTEMKLFKIFVIWFVWTKWKPLSYIFVMIFFVVPKNVRSNIWRRWDAWRGRNTNLLFLVQLIKTCPLWSEQLSTIRTTGLDILLQCAVFGFQEPMYHLPNP